MSLQLLIYVCLLCIAFFGLLLASCPTDTPARLRPPRASSNHSMSFFRSHPMPAHSMTILITGASQPAALALARLLRSQGHIVIGSDDEPLPFTSLARWSRAYNQFYAIDHFPSVSPYWVEELDVKLWIPFDTLPAHEHVENMPYAVLGRTGGLFSNNHDFRDFMRKYVPAAMNDMVHEVTSTQQVLDVLNTDGRKWLLKPTPTTPTTFINPDFPSTVIDGVRGRAVQDLEWHRVLGEDATRELVAAVEKMVDEEDNTVVEDFGFLKREDKQDDTMVVERGDQETEYEIQGLKISEMNPFTMSEVPSGAVYTVHALVINNVIQTLIITTPAPGLRDTDFVALDPHTAIHTLLTALTGRFVEKWTEIVFRLALFPWNWFSCYHGQRKSEDKFALTSFLNIEFVVCEEVVGGELRTRVMAKSVNTMPDESLILLARAKGVGGEMGKRILRACEGVEGRKGEGDRMLVYQPDEHGVKGTFSFPMLVWELVKAVVGVLCFRAGSMAVLMNLLMGCFLWSSWFVEELWDRRDPGPAIVKWLVLLPLDVVDGWLVGFLWGDRRDGSDEGDKWIRSMMGW